MRIIKVFGYSNKKVIGKENLIVKWNLDYYVISNEWEVSYRIKVFFFESFGDKDIKEIKIVV